LPFLPAIMPRIRRKTLLWIVLIALSGLLFLAAIAFAIVVLFFNEWACIPGRDEILNRVAISDVGSFHHWGRYITADEAAELSASPEDAQMLMLENGTIPITQELTELGRDVFYEETFGNEIFMTDILGMLNGPVGPLAVAQAILALEGAHTTNLRVQLSENYFAGDLVLHAGDWIDTGIDVPKGSRLPLGLPMRITPRGVKAGISCALCHATVDPLTGLVVEGAPNADLNAGLLLALASNSAAYLPHTGIDSLDQFPDDSPRYITGDLNQRIALPAVDRLEAAVDADLVRWPPGYFDSTIDLVSNPAQTPPSFTRDAWPYSWSGFGIAGPFHGLSVFSNNVHAQNSDALSQSEIAPALFDMDRQLYIATLLQNAANERFRYRNFARKPSDFFTRIDPTPQAPGVNELVILPTYPGVTLLAPDGLLAGTPGRRAWEQHNAVAAWQNTLLPPLPVEEFPLAAQGQVVFAQGGCINCHSGPARTNNRILPADLVGTEPSRAKALRKTEPVSGPPRTWSFEDELPIEPGQVVVVEVPIDYIEPEQIILGWAHGESGGGYKVPPLVALLWSAPYLHDGGVAVGQNAEMDVGLPHTLLAGKPADPVNSLRALIDRQVRQRVVNANRAVPSLGEMHITGEGHEHWVDAESGFSPQDQAALIQFLLADEVKGE